MSSINVYARAKPMSNVVGRLDYITNPDRQEHLLAVGGQTDPAWWQQLSSDAQAAWRSSGGVRTKTIMVKGSDGERHEKTVVKRACEGREIHVALPAWSIENMDEAGRQKLAGDLAQWFQEKYGATCAVGLHESKTDGNIHAHILFSDRMRLQEPEIRVADRNTFIDEAGIRRRTKKEILDADGQLRPGCSIVKKGEVLNTRYFGERETLFEKKEWLRMVKADLAGWINEKLQPDAERKVFDPEGPYLAQVHVGKERPKEAAKQCREYNRQVKAFNAAIEDGELSIEDAHRAKTAILLSPDRLDALRSVLAGVMNTFYHEGTDLAGKSDAELDRLEVAQGMPRTATSSEEAKKQELRRLYREASIERQAARQYNKGTLDWKMHQNKARACSQRIDRLRMELGYFKEADYARKLQQIDEDQRRKDAWVMSCRSRVARLQKWCHSLLRREEYLKKQLSEIDEFSHDPVQIRKANQIYEELQEVQGKLIKAVNEECMAREKLKEEKKAARELRIASRKEKRDLKASRRRQRAADRGGR